MMVSSVFLASLLTVPVIASAANGPPTTGNGGTGTLCGSMRDASTGGVVNGAVFIMEIMKFDMPIFCMVYDGYYEFKRVPAGSYTLRGSACNYEVEFRCDVEIRKGQVTVEDFTLRRAGTVTGEVRDSVSGESVQGARVYLVDGQAHNYVFTSSTGSFGILNVVPGTYTLAVEKDGYIQYVHPTPVLVREWVETRLGPLFITPV